MATCREHSPEESIVWLEDVSGLPYVREMFHPVAARPMRPPVATWARGGLRIVGYATIPRGYKADVYTQRLFVLKSYDPYDNYPDDMPAEAVDPRKVRP